MATVGILVALPAMVQFIIERLIINGHWKLDLGTQVIITPGLGPSPKETWLMPGGWVLDSDQVIVFVTAVLCAVGLWLLMRHTPLGLRMRAVVDRPVLAQLRGVNRSSTSSIGVGASARSSPGSPAWSARRCSTASGRTATPS